MNIFVNLYQTDNAYMIDKQVILQSDNHKCSIFLVQMDISFYDIFQSDDVFICFKKHDPKKGNDRVMMFCE